MFRNSDGKDAVHLILKFPIHFRISFINNRTKTQFPPQNFAITQNVIFGIRNNLSNNFVESNECSGSRSMEFAKKKLDVVANSKKANITLHQHYYRGEFGMIKQL